MIAVLPNYIGDRLSEASITPEVSKKGESAGFLFLDLGKWRGEIQCSFKKAYPSPPREVKDTYI